MSKVYRFAFDDKFDENSYIYPQATTIKQRIYVDECSTWVPVLWQFCKFLEASGYEGVRERVVIKDPYGMHSDDELFETIGPEDDEELDEDIEEAVDDYFEDEERANY